MFEFRVNQKSQVDSMLNNVLFLACVLDFIKLKYQRMIGQRKLSQMKTYICD